MAMSADAKVAVDASEQESIPQQKLRSKGVQEDVVDELVCGSATEDCSIVSAVAQTMTTNTMHAPRTVVACPAFCVSSTRNSNNSTVKKKVDSPRPSRRDPMKLDLAAPTPAAVASAATTAAVAQDTYPENEDSNSSCSSSGSSSSNAEEGSSEWDEDAWMKLHDPPDYACGREKGKSNITAILCSH